MKMNKTQLKEAVKAVVRECLNERAIREINGVQGADSKLSMLDDIVRGIIKLAPAIKNNPDKIAKVAALFFHRQYGKVADGEAVMAAVERNMGYDKATADEPVAKSGKDPVAEPEPAEEGGSEEQDECGSSCEEEEESAAPKEEEEESKSEEEESVDENAQYKHVSDNQVDTTEEDKARTIQTDPEVNENAAKTLPPNKGQYKVATARQYATTDQNKALTIQTDPKVNESEKSIKFSNLAPKKVKENHRVQTRSHVTVKDNPNDPNVMRDPENPQSNGA